MTPVTSETSRTSLRVPGALLALAASLTFLGIGAYFASGAVADDPGDPAQAAAAMAAAGPSLQVSAYLSIAGNVVLAIAASMLALLGGWAQRATRSTRRVDLPGVWATLVLATLLILPFDLALPRGFIPLAQEDPEGVVFAALYASVNLAHSVGLVVFYLATTALFVHQARTAPAPSGRRGWGAAAAVSLVAVVVAVGLVIEEPPVVLVPAVFLTWFGLFWLGLRMLRGGPGPSPQDDRRPVSS